jgi:hypothetical protein
MRLSHSILGLVGFAALCTPPAKADLMDATAYVIHFTANSPGDLLPTAGSFTYDPDTHVFSSFFVTWDGVTLDITARANSPTVFTPPGCVGLLTGGAASFAFLSGACDSPPAGEVTLWNGAASRAGGPAGFNYLTGDQACVNNDPANCKVFMSFGQAGGAADNRATGQGTWSIEPVPEPSSILLMLTAAGAALLRTAKRAC